MARLRDFMIDRLSHVCVATSTCWGPVGIDGVELGAHVDVVPDPLEGEDARRLPIAGGELGALLEGIEDALRVGADLRDDQRVGHDGDGAIMG